MPVLNSSEVKACWGQVRGAGRRYISTSDTKVSPSAMHFRLGRSRGSPREEEDAAGQYLSSSSSPAEQVFDAGCIRNQLSEYGTIKSHKEMMDVPQFLPALDPLSDPSSDEYESSPEQHRNHHHYYGRRHHKQSPQKKLLSVFHRHKQQPPDEDSVALGIARGAAQAHADSNSEEKEGHDNGFLNILLGEHAQIMGQLQQHDDGRRAEASTSHPVYATPTKRDDRKASSTPPPPAPVMSSLQRRLAQKDACLLYTSPSPRDAHEPRMPSSA